MSHSLSSHQERLKKGKIKFYIKIEFLKIKGTSYLKAKKIKDENKLSR